MMCLHRQGILQAPPLNVHSIYQLLPFSLQGSGGRVSTIHIFYQKTKLRIFLSKTQLSQIIQCIIVVSLKTCESINIYSVHAHTLGYS